MTALGSSNVAISTGFTGASTSETINSGQHSSAIAIADGESMTVSKVGDRSEGLHLHHGNLL